MQKLTESKNRNEKGAIFSIEAAISILCFAMLLTTVNYTEKQSLKEVLITEQANDLLRVWSTGFETTDSMKEDANILFEDKAEIYVNGNKILSAREEINSISTEGIILNKFLEESNIRIVVYYK